MSLYRRFLAWWDAVQLRPCSDQELRDRQRLFRLTIFAAVDRRDWKHANKFERYLMVVHGEMQRRRILPAGPPPVPHRWPQGIA